MTDQNLREDIFRVEDDGMRYRWNKRAESWDPCGKMIGGDHYEEGPLVWFSQLDDDDVVVGLTAIDQQYCESQLGILDSKLGAEYCNSLFDVNLRWHIVDEATGQASIGWKFYRDRGVYIGPSPYPSWVLNDKNVWVAPVPYPDDGSPYYWDEETKNWVLIPAMELKEHPYLRSD